MRIAENQLAPHIPSPATDGAITPASRGFVERVSTGLTPRPEFEGDEGLVFVEVASRFL